MIQARVEYEAGSCSLHARASRAAALWHVDALPSQRNRRDNLKRLALPKYSSPDMTVSYGSKQSSAFYYDYERDKLLVLCITKM